MCFYIMKILMKPFIMYHFQFNSINYCNLHLNFFTKKLKKDQIINSH